MANISELAQALAELEKDKVNALVDAGLKKGVSPLEILGELNSGMTEVGERFTKGDYFLSELIYSSHIMKGVMEKLEPLLKGASTGKTAGKVVIGTVKGDIHDIGKNIVIALLNGAGFEVIDAGVDVPPETFVSKLKESGARVLALSALLNSVLPDMKKAVDAVAAAGLRDKVKIIIGGAPVNEEVRRWSGADFYGADAPSGVRICKEIYG